jgi:transcriptional pleiotropic regulator of transition state genes
MIEPNLGETIGIIRHFDDLGRIVIPREIRKSLSIKEGGAAEIFATKNGIFIKIKEN